MPVHARAAPLAIAATLAYLGACRREAATLRIVVAPESLAAMESTTDALARAESIQAAWVSLTPQASSRTLSDGPDAPDVVVSTDVSVLGRLSSTRRCDEASRTFLGFASLVVITSPDAPRVDAVRDLAGPRFARIGVLDPDVTPSGRATAQVLESLGLTPLMRPRLTRFDAALEAVARVRRGDLDAAIVPRAAVSEGDSLEVPGDLHQPIEQAAIICARSPSRRDAATRALRFLSDGEGRRTLEAWGYSFP